VISEKTYLLILAALGVERVFELLLSRRNAGRVFARGGTEVEGDHYRIMVAFHTLFFLFCVVESAWRGATVAPLVFWGAVATALTAQALRYTAIWTLGDRWNTRVIVQPGCEPVTGGIYRWIRHPNYLGVILETAAVPLIGGAWATAVVFSVGQLWLLARRISVEEDALGSSYAQKFSSRPRFIPIARGNRD
jgi:methyltransferase